jgi:hypothetical protein
MASGVCLNAAESMVVQRASVLHQEIHALCFTSETVRQIDFTRSMTALPSQVASPVQGVEFLSPILDLLRLGLTRCNRVILRGCAISASDIGDLAEALSPGVEGQGPNLEPIIRPAISLEVLDIAGCGLSDVSLRTLFHVLSNSGRTLQRLDVSGNYGRLHAVLVSAFTESLYDMRSLNLSGCLMGYIDEPLISSETLSRLDQLEELDLSGFRVRALAICHGNTEKY